MGSARWAASTRPCGKGKQETCPAAATRNLPEGLRKLFCVPKQVSSGAQLQQEASSAKGMRQSTDETDLSKKLFLSRTFSAHEHRLDV